MLFNLKNSDCGFNDNPMWLSVYPWGLFFWVFSFLIFYFPLFLNFENFSLHYFSIFLILIAFKIFNMISYLKDCVFLLIIWLSIIFFYSSWEFLFSYFFISLNFKCLTSFNCSIRGNLYYFSTSLSKYVTFSLFNLSILQLR